MVQICTNGVQDYARLGRKGDPLGIVKEIKYVLENETYKILWDFEIQIDHLILARR